MKIYLPKKLISATFCTLAILTLFSVAFNYYQSSKNNLDTSLLEAASIGSSPLSSLGEFQKMDFACVLHPYAIRAGQTQVASLDRVFKNVDYEPWRRDILKRHVDGYFWTIYSGTAHEISARLPLKPTSSFGYKMAADFKAGCYTPDSICLEKISKDSDKKLVVLFHFCK